jgi:hypothetical protein
MAAEFIEFAVNLTNSEQSPELRATCQSLVAIAPQLIPNEVSTYFCRYIGGSIRLAIELCAADRESPGIEFLFSLIDSVIMSTDCTERLVELLLLFGEEGLAAQNFPSAQTSVYAMAAVLGCGPEDLEEYSDRMMSLVLSVINIDGPLFDVSCTFLTESSKFCPTFFAKYFRDVITRLFKHISHPLALQTLDYVLGKSESSQLCENGYYCEIIASFTALLETCGVTEYPDVLACIGSTLSNVNTTDDTAYVGMRSIVMRILCIAVSEKAVRCSVYELLGHLARISPLSASGDVAEWMQGLTEWFNGEDDEFSEAVAVFIENIVRVLPISFCPFAKQIVPVLLRLLQKEVVHRPSEEEDEENIESAGGMQGSVLLAIAELISALPEEMSDFVPDFLSAVILFWNCGEECLQLSAAKCVLLMCDGLKAMGFKQSHELFDLVIESLHDVSEVGLACEILTDLGTLMVTFSSDLDDVLRDRIIALLKEFLRGKIKAVMVKGSLANNVVHWVFFALRSYVIATAGCRAEEVVSLLKIHINGKRALQMGYAVHIMCVLSTFKPEYAKGAAELCLNVLFEGPSETVTNLMLSGINYILVSSPEALNGNDLHFGMQIVRQILSDASAKSEMLVGTATTLYLSIAAVLGPSADEMAEVLRCSRFVVDDDDIPFIARFLWKAAQLWPEVIEEKGKDILTTIFSSGSWLLELVPADVMSGLGGLIRGIPEEEMWSLVKWNQRYFLQIARNRDIFR